MISRTLYGLYNPEWSLVPLKIIRTLNDLYYLEGPLKDPKGSLDPE